MICLQIQVPFDDTFLHCNIQPTLHDYWQNDFIDVLTDYCCINNCL